MAFRQGLFDSTEIVEVVEGYPQGDNAETADFFADTIHSILGDGVSLVPTSSCNVIVKSGMIVTVKAGKLYKNGYKAWLTEDLDITLTSSSSEQTLYIGVRLDVINNKFTGDNVAARTDFDADTDIVTAIIVIPADAVVITDDMITDTRYSTTYCGVVDQYRIALAAIVEEFEDALDTIVADGLPAHASTHEVDGTDPVTERYEATFESTGWTATDDISAETDVSGGSVEIVGATFKTAVSGTVGTYTFTYVLSETSWQLDSTNVSLSTYGITLTGSPSDGDTITAEYAVKYVQSDSVSGITSGMVLKADLSLDDSLTMTTRLAQISAFSNVSRIDSGTDTVTLTCFESEPDEDFTILVEVAL